MFVVVAWAYTALIQLHEGTSGWLANPLGVGMMRGLSCRLRRTDREPV